MAAIYSLSDLKYYTLTLTGQQSGLEPEVGALEAILHHLYSDSSINCFPLNNVYIELLEMDKDMEDYVCYAIRNVRT